MSARNHTLHVALTTLTLATASALAAQTTSSDQIASIDPRVPAAAGKPCVVDLFDNRPWPQAFVYIVNDPQYNYTPPADCKPPWSKVILKLDLQSTRRSVVDTLGMDLANVRLYRSAAPRYGGTVSWHIERDLTDYSALFKTPQTGALWSTQNPEAIDYVTDSFAFHASAKLFFYRSSPSTPAPNVPDAVIGMVPGTPVNLPHNITRAYLDVETDYQDNPYWFTCTADDSGNLPLGDFVAPGGTPRTGIFPPDEGCGGGNFREIKVDVDGTPAGIAPVFPLVVADMNWLQTNSADQPITTLEMLNFKPYRVDLTPFAAVLSAPGSHNVAADNGGSTLLLYLDPHSNQTSGAVTLNTLATENGAPTDVNTLKQTGLTILGSIKTQEHRDFRIRGFVYTSRGRTDSLVHQTNDFNSTQFFHLIGPQLVLTTANKLYDQNIQMQSTTQQTSIRSIGGRLLSLDKTTVQYPLDMIYYIANTQTNNGDSYSFEFTRTNITVRQARIIDSIHYRSEFGPFISHATGHFHSVLKGGDEQPDPLWQSFTSRAYRDNFGSCYRATMTSANGTILDTTEGRGCPNGHNWVIWFAHPDGSPGTVDWRQ